ncbi:hypothetical protein D3C81_1023520 [compost metagenome]
MDSRNHAQVQVFDQQRSVFSLLNEMLAGDFTDSTWHFLGRVPGVAPSYYTVRWDVSGELREAVMYAAWPTWMAYGQQLVKEVCDSPSSRIRSAGSVVVLARSVRAFCMFCCFDQALISIRHFGCSHTTAYIDYVRQLQLSKSAAEARLAALGYAWRERSSIGQGPEVRPFGHRERAAIARRIGVQDGHTPTIPPQELFGILNEAFGLIDAAPSLLADLQLYLSYTGSDSSRSAWFERKCGRPSSALFREVRATYGACIAVLLSFTSARKHEGAAIEEEDVARTINESVDLASREYKGARCADGRGTSRPLIDAVKKALDVIRGLTKETRLRSRERTLLIRVPFQHSCSKKGGARWVLDSRGIYNLLDAFSAHIGITHKLRPHVFRRAYALLWTWRFEMEDLFFLSRVMLHNDPGFTKAYIDDEDSWSFMPEAVRELTVHVLEESLLGMRELGGGVSSTLRRYLRILQSQVVTVDPHSVDVIVRRIVDDHGLRVVANSDGYCFMSAGRAKRARCSLDGVMPNYGNRTPEMCAGCPNFGVDLKRESVWMARLERHEVVLRTTDYPELRAASRKAIVMCKRVLRWIRKELGHA